MSPLPPLPSPADDAINRAIEDRNRENEQHPNPLCPPPFIPEPEPHPDPVPRTSYFGGSG
jgi:hypothetical protein